MEKELKNGTFEPSLKHSCAKKRASRIFFSVRENVFAAQYREKLEITDFTFQAETGSQDLCFEKPKKCPGDVTTASHRRHSDVYRHSDITVTSPGHFRHDPVSNKPVRAPIFPPYQLPGRKAERADGHFVFFSFLDPRWIRNSGHYSRTFFPNVLFVYFYFPHDYAFEPHTMDGVILPPPFPEE